MELTIKSLSTAEPPLDLGASDWMVVDQSRIAAFADATGDHQWIHLDAERARQTPFGGTIAHGFLLVALVPCLFAEIFRVTDAEMVINYGLDKVRFLQPVRSGSELRLSARIEAVTTKGERLLLRIRGDLETRPAGSDAERARRAVVLESLFLVVPPGG